MIIKGKSRRNGSQLGKYLFDNYKQENEKIELFEVKGTTSKDPKKAILEMSLAAELTKGKLGLYHASLNPEIGQTMTPKDWLKALDITEKKLGLVGQNRVCVVHEKIGEDGQKRTHMHVVWQREKDGKLITDSKNYDKHLEAQSEIEKTLGQTKTLNPKQIKDEVTQCYNEAKTGQEFINKLKEKGYQVGKDYVTEKGGKRDFCLVTPDGQKSDLVRQIEKARVKEVRQKLENVRLPDAKTITGHQKRSNAQNEKARREGVIASERENKAKAKERAKQAGQNFQDVGQKEKARVKEVQQKLENVRLPDAKTITGHQKRSNAQNEKARREGVIASERENKAKAEERAKQAGQNFQDVGQKDPNTLTKQEKFEQRLKEFRENSQENDKGKTMEKAAKNKQDTTEKELSSFEKRLKKANENMQDFGRERKLK